MMNITQAKSAMKRLIGDRAMWRYDERAPKAEERKAIEATLPALREAEEKAKAAMQARRDELLRDPEYQRLKTEWQAADKARSNALSLSHHYRVTILKDRGFAAVVLAQADNWQDAIDKLKVKA